MSEEFYGKGIIVASGFDLSAKSPLDTRSIVNTIEERNAHVTGNRVYEGMKVYVLAEKKEYRYNGNDWEEVGGITDEQLEKLTIAYEHSQTPHVTEEYVDAKISDTNGYINEMLGGKRLMYLTQAEYDILTEEEKNNADIVYNITDSSEEYVTKTELESKGYLTEHQDISGKVDKVEGKSLISDTEIERLANVDNYDDTEIKAELNNKANISDLHQHSNKEVLDSITTEKVTSWDNKSDFSGSYNDLTNKPNIPTKTSELTNDSGFLTSVPSEYVTETELEAKGYLTEHQSLSNYATKDELHNHDNKAVLDGITADKVTSWDNKSDFDGDYNSLTNKPTIPSKTSELVNDSTYVTESGVLEIIENSGGIGGATEVSQGETEPTEESVLLWIDTTSDENMVENNLSDSLIIEFQDSISTLNTRISTLEKNIEPPFGEDAHTHSNKAVLDKITQSYFDKWNNKSDFNGSYNSLTDKPTIPTRTSELINNSNYVTTDEMNQAIADITVGEQVDLTNYQTKTDNTLNTTDKTVIGAINEVNANLGNKISSSELNTAISSYVTENREELKGDKGDKGDKGATGQNGITPTLSVGTTTTGAAGSNASVSMEGNLPNYTLNFTIPKGDKGDKGDRGATGQDGTTPTLSIGTVTTGNAGSNASVTMTGSSPNYTLNFTIPKGDKGDSGSGGNVDLTNYQTKTDNSLNTTNKTIVGAINEVKTSLGNKSNTNHTHSQYITSSSIPTSLPANGGNANTVGGYTIWVGTQAEYDAIGSKSSTTIYFIKG